MIIDFHTHIKTEESWNVCFWIADREHLLAYMDQVGIDMAVVLPVEGYRVEEDGSYISTDGVLEAVNGIDRLIPFFSVNPLDDDAVDRARKYIDAGCAGFGEHKSAIPVDHENSKRLYNIGVPVLLHIDRKYNYDLMRLRKVLEEFTGTNFITHGPGWWSHIARNVPENVTYPTGRVEEEGLVVEMLEEYENLYADISARSGYNALTRDPEFGRNFVKKFSDKLIFGTDFPAFDTFFTPYGPNRKHINLLREWCDEGTFRKIVEENAMRILGEEI